MTYLNYYLTPIECEVFLTGSLMRGVEHQQKVYEQTFNRRYDFSLTPVDAILRRPRDSESYFTSLFVKPSIATDDLPIAPAVGTDVLIETEDPKFVGSILAVRHFDICLEVRRTRGIGGLVLTDQTGYVKFGNSEAAFLNARQAIRGLMWGRHNVPQNNWMKELLLGHENDSLIDQSVGNLRAGSSRTRYDVLNEQQKMAFDLGARFGSSLRARLTIIQSPPGTGKTAVLVNLIIRALSNNERVLVTAETNHAVQTVAGGLISLAKDVGQPLNSVYLLQREVLQALNSAEDQGEDFIPEGDPFDYLREGDWSNLIKLLERDSTIQDLSLASHIARQLKKSTDPDERSKFSKKEIEVLFRLRACHVDLINAHTVSVEPSDPEVTKAVIKHMQTAFNTAWLNTLKYYLASAKVVCVTAGSASLPALRRFMPQTIILDEASQMTEVASVTVVATFFASVRKLILAGDLKQNSPFVGASTANEFIKTTQRSWMERLTITGAPFVSLVVQYRMHPDINATISREFYNGKLLDHPSVLSRPGDIVFKQFLKAIIPGCERHSIFLNVPGGELFRAKKGGSKVNPQYVKASQTVLRLLHENGASLDDIGLLTFCQAQLRIHQAKSPISVHTMTADACEGRQYPYVIVDLVTPGGKDYSLGFLSEAMKINVALSRAQYGLVIIGNPLMGNVPYANAGAKLWERIRKSHMEHDAIWEIQVDDARDIKEQFDIPRGQYESAFRKHD